MTKPIDKTEPDSNARSSASKSKPTASSAKNRDEQHFWRALKKDDEIQTLHKTPDAAAPASPVPKSAKPIDLTADISDLSHEERKQRRDALRSMLDINEARQQGAIRARKPTPEAGLRVGVRSGNFKGKQGVILDADYIQSRALLDMEDEQQAHWVEFGRLESVVDD
ncbi:MAG: hypothetical protein AB8B79_11120 [Granulosicoccus sp.]